MTSRKVLYLLTTAIIFAIFSLPLQSANKAYEVNAAGSIITVSSYEQFYSNVSNMIKTGKSNCSMKVNSYNKQTYSAPAVISQVLKENKALKYIVSGYSERTTVNGKSAQIDISVTYCNADVVVGTYEEYLSALKLYIKDAKASVKIKINDYNDQSFDINKAISDIREQEDFYYFTNCNYQLQKSIDSKSGVGIITFIYKQPGDKILESRKQLEAKADEIIKAYIKPGMSDYEKEKVLHDYIVKNSRYDEENYRRNTIPVKDHGAYGILVKGIGVCDGYAWAMKLLCDRAGLECLIVSGSAAGALSGAGPEGQVSHAWNIIKIDGEYYHIDVTWDDTSVENSSSKYAYGFFNLTDKEMSRSHIWVKNKYPLCESLKYNYYYYNHIYASSYLEVEAIVAAAARNKEKQAALKIADFSEKNYDIKDLVQKIMKKYSIYSANWSISNETGVIDFTFQY